MQKNESFFFVTLISFCLGFFIIENFTNFIPLHENSVTDYIQDHDIPFFNDTYIFFDISYGLFLFVIIFKLIDYINDNFLKTNLKILWIVKNFFTFFIILLFEKNGGLDQEKFFDIINNEKNWAYHFGYITNFFSLSVDQTTSNFLLIYNYFNIFLINTWFGTKVITNIFFLVTIYFSYKIYLKFNNENSKLIFYLFGFSPSLFFFSSMITKDTIIVFYLLISFYSFLNIDGNYKQNIKHYLIIIICIILISLIRYWIGIFLVLAFTIPLISKVLINNLKKYNHFFILSLFVCLFLLILFFFETDLWNNFQIEYKIKQFHRIYNWHYHDPLEYNIMGVNAENLKDFYLKDYWKMMILTIFNLSLNSLNELKFYPFIFEGLFIIFMIFYSIGFKKVFIDKNIFFLILFILFYSILYAFGGTQMNTGTSLRYSIQVKYVLYVYLISINSKILITFIMKIFSNFLRNSYK